MTGRRVVRPMALAVVLVFVAACSTEPAVTDPSTAEPSLEPSTVSTVPEPAVPEPAVSGPVVTEPPVSDPGVTEPPVSEPPEKQVACSGASIEARTEAYASAPGVDPDRLSLDVYRPLVGERCPIVMWVHGGGWHVGDRSNNVIATKAAWFTERGSVFVAINYRLASPDGGAVMWPTMGVDVAQAVRWVVDNAESIGADPADLALVGHSAGAHLASAVAVDPDLLGSVGLDRSVVRCVVVLDTAAYDLTRPMYLARPLVLNAFGGDPEVLADASPLVQLERHGGPVADTLVVVRGSRRRVLQSQEYADAVRSSGAAAEVFDAGQLSHEDVNRLLGVPGDDVVTPVVAAFLDRCVPATD
jgi:acetyl esterase/lipase